MSVRRLKFLHRSRCDATMGEALVLATGSATASLTLCFDGRNGIKAQKNSCPVAPSGCSPCSSPPPDGAGGTPLRLPHPHSAELSTASGERRQQRFGSAALISAFICKVANVWILQEPEASRGPADPLRKGPHGSYADSRNQASAHHVRSSDDVFSS